MMKQTRHVCDGDDGDSCFLLGIADDNDDSFWSLRGGGC